MANKVLVAYGSKYGSTKQIAEKVAEVLKQEGLETDVVSGDKVKDISGYKDIIVGAAVYIGMARKEVKGFLQKNEAALKEKRVWFFYSGPSGKGDTVERVKRAVIPQSLKQIFEVIKPKDTVVFHGNLDPQRMKGLEKWIVQRVGGDTGDFRDWDMIIAWAKKVAAEIKK
jgi:menaquinone-dependent protoporphyrinogen oxidase